MINNKKVRELEIKLKEAGKIHQNSYLYYDNGSIFMAYGDKNETVKVDAVEKEDVENYEVVEVMSAIEHVYGIKVDNIKILQHLNKHIFVCGDISVDTYGLK